MDELDSRRLTAADCYGRRFLRPGVYAYEVRAADDDDTSAVAAYPFVVEVGAATADSARQHAVVIRTGHDGLVADPATIRVQAGDFVVWQAGEVSPAFVIAGHAGCFGNDPLRDHCRYSHAFACAGVYEWGDANGSGLHGVVNVVAPRIACDEDRRQRVGRLRSSVLVMIRGTRAEPPEVTIESGQRVYFAVLSSPGVTVTDVRLVTHEARGPRRATSG
jgi:plastocyanin